MTDTTPITDLGLSATLPTIGWDAERLRSFALSIKERYTGLVVTEDEIAKTKHEMAELNRLKKQIDDARLEFEPAREGEINQVLRHLETLCTAFTRSVSCPQPASISAPHVVMRPY